jgi:hypothetical protein
VRGAMSIWVSCHSTNWWTGCKPKSPPRPEA